MTSKLIGLMILYGLLSIGLGLYGYLGPQKSMVSLIAGGAVGALVIGCAALAKVRPRWGYIGATVIAIAMLGRFMPAFIEKRDWVPAGIMTVASAILAIVLLGAHFAATASRRREASRAEGSA